MKKYLTVSFLVLLTAATVIAWYRSGPMHRRYSARSIQVAPAARSTEKTAKISIRWRDVHTTLLRKNGKWFVEERGSRLASAGRISALLNSLNTLHPVKEIRNLSPEILKELRLVENDPKLIPGVRLTLYDDGNNEIFSMLLGKGHFVRSEPGMPPSPDAEGRYVLIGGKVFLIPVVFENCHPLPAVWVEPLRLHELRRSIRMNVQTFDGEKGKPMWAVYRKSTAHPFTLAYPAGDPLADNQQLSALADRLSKPFSMDYFIPEKDWKPDLRHRLSILRADGVSYDLELYSGPAEYDVAALRMNFDPGKVLRYPDETDPQYQRRCDGLKPRFEEEKSFSEGMLFKVPKDLSRLLNTVPKKK